MISKRFLGVCAVTCLCIAWQNCFSQINTEIDFKKCILEKCWDAWASKTVNNDNKKGWYSMSRYSKSIYECIATAIADCITEKGQFTKSHIEDDYVAFDVKPNMINYGPEHWNALVLYNFLYWTIGLRKIDPDNDGIKTIGAGLRRKLEKQYHLIAGIGEKIDKAVSDIKRYAEALNLRDFLNRLIKWKQSSKDKECMQMYINMGYRISKGLCFDQESKSAEFVISNAMVDVNGEFKRAHLNVVIRNGKIVEYQTPYGVFGRMTPDMKLRDKLEAKPRHNINYEDLTKSKSPNQIHSLSNYLTCHINSLLTALSMSDLFRQAIKKVAESQVKTVRIGGQDIPLSLCKCIQEIIDAVDDGSMSYGLKGSGFGKYQLAFEKLREALSQTLAIMDYKDKRNMNIHNINTNDKTSLKIDSQIQKNFKNSFDDYYNNSAIRPRGTDQGAVTCGILPAISYEFECYGIQDVLWASWIDQLQSQKTKSIDSENYAADCPSRFNANKCQVNSNNMPVQDLIQQSLERLGVWLTGIVTQTGPRNDECIHNDTLTITNRIRILPNVLCVLTPKSADGRCPDIQLSDTIEIQDTQGTKKYRLVSEVLRMPGHFVARVKLQNKFYIVDDFMDKVDSAVEENEYFTQYKTSNNTPRDIHVAIYERCD